MYIITLLATTAASVAGLAIPQGTTGGPFSPYPSSTNITYYDGSCASGDSCTNPSGNDTLNASTCTIVTHVNLGIEQAPNNACSLTLYKGTTYCGGESEKVMYQIAAGNATMCVDMDVSEGEKASMVWMCS